MCTRGEVADGCDLQPPQMDGGPWGGSGSLDDMGVDVDVLDMVAMGNRFREHLMSPPLDAADVSGPMASPVLRRNRWAAIGSNADLQSCEAMCKAPCTQCDCPTQLCLTPVQSDVLGKA